MLFIVVSLGQKPELVAAVIEPLAGTRGEVLAREFRIYEQVNVAGKDHLHQPATVLRHDNQLEPLVRELLRMPALMFDRVDAADCTFRRILLTECRGETQGRHDGECNKSYPDDSQSIQSHTMKCHDRSSMMTTAARLRVARRTSSQRLDCKQNESQ